MSEWKLVPVDATDDMLDRGQHYCDLQSAGLVDEAADDVWAAMLIAAPPPPSQWPQPRPMSEAPKQVDAWPPEKILAWWPGSKEWVATWWWTARSMWIHALSETDEQQPTHWLPLPAAPAEQEVTK
jgi:hypothetical protein